MSCFMLYFVPYVDVCNIFFLTTTALIKVSVAWKRVLNIISRLYYLKTSDFSVSICILKSNILSNVIISGNLVTVDYHGKVTVIVIGIRTWVLPWTRHITSLVNLKVRACVWAVRAMVLRSWLRSLRVLQYF